MELNKKSTEAAFNNKFQNALESFTINSRIIHQNGKPHREFVANKKAKVAPEVVEKFMDDNGDIQYVLQNGNTVPQEKYISLWQPVKLEVLPKHHKGI